MTPSQLEHLRRIDAHLEQLLAIAEKRTPGWWDHGYGNSLVVHKKTDYTIASTSSSEIVEEDCPIIPWGEQVANSEFIASCAGNAEAGWRATRAAIAEILAAHEARFESWCLVCQELNQDPGKLEDYPLPPWSDDILAAFPLELIQKP